LVEISEKNANKIEVKWDKESEVSYLK
jgi:hypothetical protein